MLSAADIDTCGQALTLLKQAAAQAAATASPGLIQSAWANLIGATSALEAAQSDAHAEQVLADTMAAKLDGWRADPSLAGPDDAVQFVRDCGRYCDTTQLEATMAQVTPAAAVAQVAAGTVADLESGAKKIGTGLAIGSGLVVVLVVLAGAFWLSVRR